MPLIPQRTPLQNAVVGQSITLHMEVCRSLTYPWLELVIEEGELAGFYTQAIVSHAFQTRDLSLNGMVTRIANDFCGSRVVSVEVPRVDNKGVVTFTFYADRLNTPNPRIFPTVTV